MFGFNFVAVFQKDSMTNDHKNHDIYVKIIASQITDSLFILTNLTLMLLIFIATA